jgi:O-antigen/teichoic acid export membrane protein
VTRTRRFVRGVGAGYLNQAIVMLVGLWLTRFLLEQIGQRDYGLWLVANQVLAYLGLLDFGLSGLIPRETAYATGRATGAGDRAEVAAVVGPITRLVLGQTVLVAIGAVAAWHFLPVEWAALRGPLAIVFIAFVALFPLRIFPGVLAGLQDLAFVGATQLVAWSAATAVTVAMVVAGFGLTSLAAGWVVGQTIPAAVALVRLRRHFPGVLTWPLAALSLRNARAFLARGGWIGLNQVAQALMAGTDLVIMGKVLGPAAVVPYAVTGKLAMVFGQQPQLLLQAAQPGLAELRTSETPERVLQAATALTTVVLVMSGLLLCVVLAVNHGFLVWWLGAPQWGGFTLTTLIVLRVLVGHWLVTISTVVFCFGHERRLAVTAMIDGIIAVGLTVVLVRALGPAGAPLAGIVAHGIISIPANLHAISRDVRQSVLSLIGALWPWAWRFALLAATALLAGTRWTPTSVPALAFVSTLTAGAYAIVMVPLVLRPPVSLYVHPGISAALKRLPAALRGGVA